VAAVFDTHSVVIGPGHRVYLKSRFNFISQRPITCASHQCTSASAVFPSGRSTLAVPFNFLHRLVAVRPANCDLYGWRLAGRIDRALNFSASWGRVWVLPTAESMQLVKRHRMNDTLWGGSMSRRLGRSPGFLVESGLQRSLLNKNVITSAMSC